ncbi:MAG: hypothetical protein V2A61_05990, partial [Calditrichota bacterium]
GGVDPDSLKFIEFDSRRIHQVSLDITGCQHVGAAEKFIAEKLVQAGVRSEDIAWVELSGVFPSGSRILWGDDFIRNTCFHLRMDSSAVRPEWNLNEDDFTHPKTTEAIFRQRLKELIEEASGRGDDNEAARLQNALFYGLDALHSQPILPRSPT